MTLDTTRPDRIGVYGHPEARTRMIDRLARQGAVVEWAIADVPVTLPSHTTLMTGIPAIGHGVRYNGDYKVAPSAQTLAETLQGAGWATGAVLSALVLDSEFGLDQGFDFYEDDLTPGYVKFDESLYPEETHWLPKADRRAAEAVDLSVAWLEEQRRSFFFWLHIYDPHFPFDPPPPWAGTHDELYVAEINYTDRQLVRFMREIEASDRGEDTIVVVTSDHGEGLDQHREDGHGIFLYDDTVRIPLVIRAPGMLTANTVIGDQARSIDVAPTILELCGLQPDHGVGGTLVPALDGLGPMPDSLAYSESIKTQLFYGGTGLKAIRTKNAKYVWAPRPEFYRLDSDPNELRNAVGSDSTTANVYKQHLEDLVFDLLEQDLLAGEAHEVDAEMREQLESLGYSAGSSAPPPGSFGAEMALRGHDPKDLVDVSMAAREIQNGFYDSGERKILRFFRETRTPREDPQVARLWAAAHQNYAKIWLVRGDYAKAAEQYALAMQADVKYVSARWSRVYALNLARDYERAFAEGSALLERWPDSWRVRLHRALSLALLERTEEASEELRTIAQKAKGDLAKHASWYSQRVGTPRERAALTSYLETEERRRR